MQQQQALLANPRRLIWPMLTWPHVDALRNPTWPPVVALSNLHNHQASSAVSAPQKRPRFNREQGVVAAKVRSLAAYSVLILQVLLLLQLLLLQAVLQASKRCCKQALLQASTACCFLVLLLQARVPSTFRTNALVTGRGRPFLQVW